MSGSNPSQPEQATYDASVYQLQATDDCQGASSSGEGVLNTPLRNLANRTGWLKAAIAAVVQSLTGYAPLNSPAFTGTPTAPTPPLADSSSQVPNTYWVAQAYEGYISAIQVPPLTSQSTQGAQLLSGNNTTQSVSFTAPVAGTVVAFGGINLNQALTSNNVQLTLVISTNQHGPLATVQDATGLPMVKSTVANVNAGDQVVVYTEVYQNGNSGAHGTWFVNAMFFPT